jgi:hypothetical protein
VRAVSGIAAAASVILFGTEDCLTTGCYSGANPTVGATLEGLVPGGISSATSSYGHSYPFTPTPGDFPGTDQIYVGSSQSGILDGYSGTSQAIAGPLVLSLDYSSAVAGGQTVQTLTLGLALDDFQEAFLGQPFTISINGAPNATVAGFIPGLNQSGPIVQFFTFGLDPSLDNASHILTVSIDEGGNGGDGFAVDFATVGVETVSASPEPGTFILMLTAAGLATLAACRKMRIA